MKVHKRTRGPRPLCGAPEDAIMAGLGGPKITCLRCIAMSPRVQARRRPWPRPHQSDCLSRNAPPGKSYPCDCALAREGT
jgi:hypothetical protein